MKKFLLNMALFLIPVCLGLVYLFAGPFDKQFGYGYMLESCDKREFLYHRIFQDPDPIDIVFLGTSQTACAINDSLLEARLSQQAGSKVGVANLGFCRPGRSLHYALLKDVLKHHTPQKVIIEVRDKEDRFSHKDFPFVADNQDLFFPVFFFNQRYPESLMEGTECRFNYHKSRLLDIPPDPAWEKDPGKYNFVYSELVGDPTVLEQRLDKKKRALENGIPYGAYYRMDDQLTYRYPRQTLKRIVNLAKNAGAEVHFLFLRPYKSPVEEPKDLTRYLQLAPVIHPPDSLFVDPQSFLDFEHLNGPGANALTNWLLTNHFL